MWTAAEVLGPTATTATIPLKSPAVERPTATLGPRPTMRQRGERLCFAFEARQPLWVFTEGLRKQFDRDGAVEYRVERLPDHAHPALADLLHQAVVEQLLSGFDHRAILQETIPIPSRSECALAGPTG